jgi:hypothetical protein
MLTGPLGMFAGGEIIDFDLIGDPNVPVRLEAVPDNRLDYVICAGASEAGAQRCFLSVTRRSTTVPISDQSAAPFLGREFLLLAPGAILGADIAPGPGVYTLRLRGWLIRVALIRERAGPLPATDARG